MKADVTIIGAGLSGLACALALQERGLTPLILEAYSAEAQARREAETRALRERSSATPLPGGVRPMPPRNGRR